MAILRSRLPHMAAQQPTDSRRLTRWTVIGLLLAAVVLLGFQPSASVIPVLVGLVGAGLILRYPGLGPIAVLLGAMAVRFSVGTGTQTSLHLGFVLVPLLLGLWLAKSLHRRTLRLVPSGANLPLIGLVVTAAVSLLAGNLGWNAFAQTAPLRTQIAAVGTFAVSAGAFLLVANEVKQLAWLKRLTWIFVLLGALYLVGRVVPGAGRYTRWFQVDAAGSLFWIWLVAITFGQAFFNHDLKARWRVIYLLVGGATLLLALQPNNRSWASGWLPALASLAMLLWLRWPRWALVAGALGLLAALLNYNSVMTLLLGGGNDYSLLTRNAATEIILGIARANWLLGIGPANYFYYTPLFPILGFYVRFNSHNQYVDLIAQVGVLGLLFFILFFVAAWRLGWRLRFQVQDGFALGYVNACLAGLVATLFSGALGDWIIPFVYNLGIRGMRTSLIGWLFLGGLVAIDALTARRATAAASVPKTTSA